VFLVDPQVRVPHLKYVEVEPVVPAEGKPSVKVACMMRVKNEARWIKRTIESVRELCGADIYVMEDGSIDGTAEIAARVGAVVLPSPFVGLGLDEARDKDWLLAEVISRCSPDWVLMPDGDEELQAGGCAKIRRALETNPDCDCFAMRFLYFWDSVETIRVDGVYGTMARQSLFRAKSDFRFRSYYSKDETPNQNHVGLHTSNAPGLGGRVMNLNVALLHYGYLHREDRIRKYRWIISIDPHNEGEGFYLHCVQGDIPDIPVNAILKHAGPLKLQRLPARLVPQFENGVPGSWSPEMASAADVAGNGGMESPEFAAAD
jgi:glycosyltransferase involved in cell wall biosynthesis